MKNSKTRLKYLNNIDNCDITYYYLGITFYTIYNIRRGKYEKEENS